MRAGGEWAGTANYVAVSSALPFLIRRPGLGCKTLVRQRPSTDGDQFLLLLCALLIRCDVDSHPVCGLEDSELATISYPPVAFWSPSATGLPAFRLALRYVNSCDEHTTRGMSQPQWALFMSSQTEALNSVHLFPCKLARHVTHAVGRQPMKRARSTA